MGRSILGQSYFNNEPFIGYFLLLSIASLLHCISRHCRRGGCYNRHVSRHVQAIGTFRPAKSLTHQEFSRQPFPKKLLTRRQ